MGKENWNVEEQKSRFIGSSGKQQHYLHNVDEVLVHMYVIFFIKFITMFTDIVYLNFQKYILVAQE